MSVPTTGINTRLILDLETGSQGVPKSSSPIARKIAGQETLSKDKEQIVVDEVRSDPNPQDPVPGDTNLEGDLTHAPNLNTAAFLLRVLCNDYASPTGTGPYVYSGKMKGGVLKTMLAEKGYMDWATPNYEKLRGIAIKSLSFDMKGAGLLNWRLGLIGMDADALSTTSYLTGAGGTDPDDVVDWETGAKIHHAMVGTTGVKINGSDVGYLLSASGSIERTIVTEDRPIGMGGVLASLPSGKFMTTGSFKARFTSSAVLTVIQSGNPVSLEFKWQVSSSPDYYLKFIWPRIFPKYTSPKRSSDGLLELSPQFRGAYSAGSEAAFQWEVSNGAAEAEMQ